MWVLATAVFGVLAVGQPGRAEAPVQPSVPVAASATLVPAEQEQAPGDVEPERTDLYDLLKKVLRKKPGAEAPSAEADDALDFTIVPIIGSGPSTGFSIGAGARLEFPLGGLQTTRVSEVNASAAVTTRKQVRTSVMASLYGADNRWILTGDNHFMLTALDTYDLGTGPQDAAVRADYHSTRFFDTLYWRLANRLYGGVGLAYGRQTNIGPAKGDEAAWDQSPFVTYSTRHGFDPVAQGAAGPSLGLLFDNRDSAIDANKGWYADATYRMFVKGFAGGDSTWQELYLDARTYKALAKTRSQRLAFWMYGDLVTGGVGPYFSLPSTGGDTQGRSGRGYADGRFRGEHLVYGEVEYRVTLTRNGLVGAVAFLNATTVSNRDAGEHLFDVVAPAGGVGLRLLLQKRSRTNVCLDFGWGRSGERGFYLGLGEAF